MALKAQLSWFACVNGSPDLPLCVLLFGCFVKGPFNTQRGGEEFDRSVWGFTSIASAVWLFKRENVRAAHLDGLLFPFGPQTDNPRIYRNFTVRQVGTWLWLKIQELGQTAGFGPCFHLPGFHFGTGFLSHTHIVVVLEFLGKLLEVSWKELHSYFTLTLVCCGSVPFLVTREGCKNQHFSLPYQGS